MRELIIIEYLLLMITACTRSKGLRRIPLNVRAISAKNIYQKTTYSTVTF